MITSLTNEKIKEVVKLKNVKNRKEKNLFIVEGPHLVEEAKNMNVLVESYTICDDLDGILVSKEVMKKICNTDSVCQIIGICKYNGAKEITNRVLILDGVRDPGNMGTLLRSAKSFGFNTIFCSTDCVDFYNDKVIRASQGSIFKLNLITGDILQFINSLKKTHDIYGTNVKNGVSVSTVTGFDKIAVVLGNEGVGISEEVNNILPKNIYIPLDNMESLNVSVAGSIIMYELKKESN